MTHSANQLVSIEAVPAAGGNSGSIDIDAIPEELTRLRQWVLWKQESRTEGGKPTKVPYRPNGCKASVANPDNWTTFDKVVESFRTGEYYGIGFVFTKDDAYVGVDIDNCRDPKTGVIEGWAKEILCDLDSYAEVSPSGTGVKIWCKGELPGDGSGKKVEYESGAVEMYQHSRFFTVTGESVGESVVNDAQDAIGEVWSRVFGEEKSTRETSRHEVTLPMDDVDEATVGRCREMLKNRPRSVEGANGSSEAMSAAASIRHFEDRGIHGQQGLILFSEYCTEHSDPPWSASEIERKWNDSGKRAKYTLAKRVYKNTDLGNAERFAGNFGQKVKYVCTWDTWLVWDGRRWAKDARKEVDRMAQHTVRSIYNEVSQYETKEMRDEVAKWARRSESRNSIAAMLKLAQSQPSIAISHKDLDRHDWLLNGNNGTYDLKTGELLQHDPEHLITQVTGVDFLSEPCSEESRWKTLCYEIFEGDAELEGYVQRMLGAALVGRQLEHTLPIFHGSGANGKSVFTNAIQEALGDYACTAPRDLLVKGGRNEHPTMLADLHGKRLVFASETDSGQQLNEGLVKSITGSDRIKARRMKEDYWEFQPTHTIVLITNHMPVIRGDDDGIWRRISRVPFNATFTEEQQDKRLAEKLLQELPAILHWLVKGCLLYQHPGKEGGLQTPTKVAKATSAYRIESDSFLLFYHDRCVPVGGANVGASDVFDNYCEWCKLEGEQPVGQKQFSKRMNALHEKKRTSRGICYLGIQLTSGVPDPNARDASAAADVDT